ncbi:hypothetical protein L861_09435 [Litchfieldella anticariensis FP35 = DSM 16096]|uniref:HTH luxR-type domain-containing protein n=2 Tax=Litchfieldella anticariensis TaxID=258591 RepID=S2LCR4_LITA3|nr:autoinducer binding domain-containing protein [Halomonas anticariensis]EPC02556.1 hypothetical protein L861_09435 [Halomonas anticariensis FP35 = DSM 16096]
MELVWYVWDGGNAMIKSRTNPSAVKFLDIDYFDKQKLAMEVRENTGFEFFSLVLRPCIPFTNNYLYIIDNYGCEWEGLYQDKKFWTIDPVLQHKNYVNKSGILWENSLFDKSNELWRSAKDFGLCSGMSFLVSFSDMPVRGVFSISSKDYYYANNQDVKMQRYNVCPLSIKVMDCIKGKVDVGKSVANPVFLSVREADILRYSADGLTSSEISKKLYVTKSTIDFHIKNAIDKLGCKNKVQAVSKALLLDIL